MSSYAITGASKGLGLEFVRQLAANPANTVLAIVRDPQSQRIAKLASNHPNVHLIEADVGNPQSILNASKVASTITGGKLDVLIHNSNAVDMETVTFSPSQFPFDAEAVRATFELPIRVAIYGGLWTTNAFLPLIEKGAQKKIIHISSGMADLELIKNSGISYALPYSVAKAGINVQVAKYAAELAPKGIKVLALSPGWVDTFDGEKPAEVKAANAFMLGQFQKLEPTLQGQITPEESVRKQLVVIDRLDADLSGSFVSHTGSDSWF